MTETAASAATSAFVTGPQEGRAVWYLDVLGQIKAPSAATGGLISVSEQLLPEGSSPPLHVHHREDEAFYILEGTLVCQAGDQTLSATAGSFVWLPRDIPHTFRVETPTARILTLCLPGGFEEFFVAIGRPAAQLIVPPTPDGAADMETLVGHARAFGCDVVGPPMS